MTTRETGTDALRASFDAALTRCLAERYPNDHTVDASVRYALEAGGKRVRPMLCLLTAEAFGAEAAAALPAALALEFVHTYSLVHDDLPCMDDDDLRRGQPTTHKVFGEANALLAGDALLTDAFSLLADAGLPPAVRIALVRELAAAAGGSGMVLGQSLDIHWTARSGATRTALDEIHLKKTGYLLGAAAAMGAVSAGAPDKAVAALRQFGRRLGLAFQIRDDLLDAAAGTGKSPGKDQEAGKLTYLALMSRDEAEAAADRCTDEAVAALATTDIPTDALAAFAQGLLTRRR